MSPNTQTMTRVTAAAAVKALREGREVLALTAGGWEPVEAIERRKAQAGHTYYAVHFMSGRVRVFSVAGSFLVERADHA